MVILDLDAFQAKEKITYVLLCSLCCRAFLRYYMQSAPQGNTTVNPTLMGSPPQQLLLAMPQTSVQLPALSSQRVAHQSLSSHGNVGVGNQHGLTLTGQTDADLRALLSTPAGQALYAKAHALGMEQALRRQAGKEGAFALLLTKWCLCSTYNWCTHSGHCWTKGSLKFNFRRYFACAHAHTHSEHLPLLYTISPL